MDSLTKQDLKRIAHALKGSTTALKRESVLSLATDIFEDRNSKYKDAWRDYRLSTFVDRNLVKAKRLRSLEEAGQYEEVLEQALDQVNEALFMGILILEKLAKEDKGHEGTGER